MPDYAKRLQSRLSAKGYRFNKEQCRQALSAIAGNPELPTDEEMVQAFNWLTQCDSEEVEEIVTVESETSAIELSNSINSFTGLAESSGETEAIAPIEKEEQIERQTNLPSSMQEPDLGPSPKATGIVPQQSNPGIIPQGQVRDMVSSAFANQPQDFKDQVTEYALQHSFDNVRQIQEFLEQLRGMEFNLLVNTLNDHFHRRGSMLTLLEEVIEQQKQKEGESNQNFFNSFNSRLTAFQQEMQSRLSKTGI